MQMLKNYKMMVFSIKELNNAIEEAGQPPLVHDKLETLSALELIAIMCNNNIEVKYIQPPHKPNNKRKHPEKSDTQYTCPHGYIFGEDHAEYDECSDEETKCELYRMCEEKAEETF